MVAVIFLHFLFAVQSVWADNCTSKYSCNSCNVVRICRSTDMGYQELDHFTCPPDKPYCNPSGSCSVMPAVECADLDTFPCMQDGVFPNPTDCQKYHICHNSNSSTFTCPPFYNYEATKSKCVESATCYTISCFGKDGVKVAYPIGPYYAFCQKDTAILVDRCPGYYKLNTDSQECAPDCPGNGYKMPDVDDCTKFYYCSKEPFASDYTVTKKDCPEGHEFDPFYMRCVPLKMLPFCSTSRKDIVSEATTKALKI